MKKSLYSTLLFFFCFFLKCTHEEQNIDIVTLSKSWIGNIFFPTFQLLYNEHVLLLQSDDKEGWVSKNWRFQNVVLEKTLESPLDSKEIKPVNPKGSQPWIFIGRTNTEAEAPILWPPDAKNWLIWKDHDAEKDWRREEKETMDDEMVWWHHQLDGYEFE